MVTISEINFTERSEVDMAKSAEKASEVQLWLAFVAEMKEPRNAALAWEVLSPDERRHAGRFNFEHDRNTYLTSRSLRRHVLSHYADVAPKQWRFTENRYGRPCIDRSMLAGHLEFNVSRSGGIVVCAIAQDGAVGVDIERLDRAVPAGAVDAVMGPREKAALEGLPLSKRGWRFFSHWTLKEAYLKARGMGLSVPLDSIAFDVPCDPDQGMPLEASLQVQPAGDSASWRCMLLSPISTHVMAVCVQCQRQANLKIATRWVSPVDIPR